MYTDLARIKEILEFFGFKCEFRENGLEEEYIECIKENDSNKLKLIIFRNGFTTIIHNSNTYSFVLYSIQELIFRLVQLI